MTPEIYVARVSIVGRLSLKGAVSCLSEPFAARCVLRVMDGDREKEAILRKLAHCRQLAKDFPGGPTAKHIRELEEELKAELAAEPNTVTRQ